MLEAAKPGAGTDVALGRFAEIAIERFRRMRRITQEDRRLTVAFAGFSMSPLGLTRPHLAVVSNFEGFEGRPSAAAMQEFRVDSRRMAPGANTIIAIGASVASPLRRDPVMCLLARPTVPARETVDAAVRVIRQAALADVGERIGGRCSSVIIPRDSGAEMALDYHPDTPAVVLRRCADWLAQLNVDGYPPAVNLRPAGDWPDTAHIAVDLARVRTVLHRIAADLDELARARRVADLNTAATLPDRRAERRRRLAEPDLDFRGFCSRTGLPASSTPQLERAWDAWQDEKYRRGEANQRAAYGDNPFRPR